MTDLLGYFRQKLNAPAFTEASVCSTLSVGRCSDVEQFSFDTNWSDMAQKINVMNWLAAQYELFCQHPAKVHDGIHFFGGVSGRGFRIDPGYCDFDQNTLLSLFNLLRDRMLLLPYFVQTSDTRILHRMEWVETIHRHILCPDYMLDARGYRVQQFGNITIEAVMKGPHLVNLRFMSSIQHDVNYVHAQDFDDLMCVVTGQ